MKNIIILMLFLVPFCGINQKAIGLPESLYAAVGPSTVEFQLIDPLGNITGYDPITKNTINNIPNTKYQLKYVYNAGDVSPTKNEIYHIIEMTIFSDTTQILPGIYKVKIFGSTTPENYFLNIITHYNGIKPAIRADNNSFIYPNVLWTYELDIPATSPVNNKLILIKVSTPQDLITDINAAASLNLIGNPHLVSELTKEINEIEAEKSKGKIDDGLTPTQKAKKEYTELLNEITEKYNKPESDEFVKQEAYTVLKEDLEYIIGHIQ